MQKQSPMLVSEVLLKLSGAVAKAVADAGQGSLVLLVFLQHLH